MAQIQRLNRLKIPLQDIISATANFSEDNFIGRGAFGSVYKGQLPNHNPSTVAIKRLDKSILKQGQREFELEIIALASYKHSNLASLVGFSYNDDEIILVYKYEVNGSLQNHLASPDLTWEQRLRICLGAARGLEYLHGGLGTNHKVVHRNIKSSNILIDVDWETKISDFGLSNIGPTILSDCGTFGYVDPQYKNTGLLTKESDVYSFGVVLFEVLCGRPAVIPEYHDERKLLRKLVKRRCKGKKLDEIVMADLREQTKPYSLKIFLKTAYQCLNKDRKQRPSMKSIVQELQSSFEYQIAGSPTELWGSRTGGSAWSLLLANDLKLRKMTIDHGDWIFSVGFTVEDSSGSLNFCQHGGTGGGSGDEVSEINLDAGEEIIGILGTVGVTTGTYADYEVISSLCIVTNERRHGPFGEETCTRFTVPWDVGSFAGFYGRAGFYLDGLGFYSRTTV